MPEADDDYSPTSLLFNRSKELLLTADQNKVFRCDTFRAVLNISNVYNTVTYICVYIYSVVSACWCIGVLVWDGVDEMGVGVGAQLDTLNDAAHRTHNIYDK